MLISFDKSPLSIKKLSPNLRNFSNPLIAFFVSILKILFLFSKILLNFLISLIELVNERA